jgi:cytochrome c-type biogenesis protein CcmE
MNRKQKIRLYGITTLIIIIASAAGLILYALKQNINLFMTPSEILQAKLMPNQIIRLGGYVKKHSVHFNKTGDSVNFIVTDRSHDIDVTYNGLLPSLFREGQVVVITGKFTEQHTIIASQVLAKHDEKYMPKPLAKKLSKGAS